MRFRRQSQRVLSTLLTSSVKASQASGLMGNGSQPRSHEPAAHSRHQPHEQNSLGTHTYSSCLAAAWGLSSRANQSTSFIAYCCHISLSNSVGGQNLHGRSACQQGGRLEAGTDQQLHGANAGQEAGFGTYNRDAGHYCTQASPCPAWVMLRRTRLPASKTAPCLLLEGLTAPALHLQYVQ